MLVIMIITSTSIPKGYSCPARFLSTWYKHRLYAKALQRSERLFNDLINNSYFRQRGWRLRQ
jgi:hypothetical protein